MKTNPPYHTREGFKCNIGIGEVKTALEHNGFEVFTADDATEAIQRFFENV